MPITKSILYKVESFAENLTVEGDVRSYEVPGAWFKIIETGHEKHGLQFIFPLKHPDYSENLQNRLLNLEEGDTIYLQAESTNKRNTAWKVYDYSEDDTPTL